MREEIEEIKQAENLMKLAAELGDLFFVLVNLARWKKVDAEFRVAGNEYEIQEALWVCGTRRKEAGPEFIGYDVGRDGCVLG